jgi:hypothetical protein
MRVSRADIFATVQLIQGTAPIETLCLTTVMQQRLFFGPQRQLISYDNEFAVRRRRGFDWKQRS